MEGKEVTILTSPYQVLDKPDLVHEVDPGFPPGDKFSGWAAEIAVINPLLPRSAAYR
jgi:hypothetical protein